MTGWKTFAFNIALAVFGVVEAADWTALLGSQKAGIAMAVTGVVGVVLRALTSTPIFSTKPAP